LKSQSRKELTLAYKERKVVGGVYQIVNTQNSNFLLASTADLQGAQNRFDFAQKTGSCIHFKLQKDWAEFGPSAFKFEILEELEKKEDQSPKEFQEDLKVLQEMWAEKRSAESHT
jgi:hypothetical protein